MCTSRQLLVFTLVGALLSPSAVAGPSSGFLCASDQPFDQFSVVNEGSDSAIVFRLPGNTGVLTLDGSVPAGQAPYLESRDGVMVVPLQVDDKPVVDVYFRQKRIARLPGLLQDVDIGGRGDRLALVSVSMPGAIDNDPVVVTQSVVTTNGRILASRKFRMRLDEDGAQQFRLTTAGDGIYRLPSANVPVHTLEVLDSRDFRTRLSIAAPGLVFTDIRMQTVLDGFAIGNGQLYRIADGKLHPMTTPEDAFTASRLEFDPRADRLLVRGANGFWVFDGRGRKLLGQRGLSAVRLTIEGDAVLYRGKDKLGQLWLRDGRYAAPQPVSMAAIPNWNTVACMTSSSAAVMQRNVAGEQGQLVRFRRPPNP